MHVPLTLDVTDVPQSMFLGPAEQEVLLLGQHLLEDTVESGEYHLSLAARLFFLGGDSSREGVELGGGGKGWPEGVETVAVSATVSCVPSMARKPNMGFLILHLLNGGHRAKEIHSNCSGITWGYPKETSGSFPPPIRSISNYFGAVGVVGTGKHRLGLLHPAKFLRFSVTLCRWAKSLIQKCLQTEKNALAVLNYCSWNPLQVLLAPNISNLCHSYSCLHISLFTPNTSKKIQNWSTNCKGHMEATRNSFHVVVAPSWDRRGLAMRWVAMWIILLTSCV